MKNIAKMIFDTVYKWGRVGVVTDENCNAFQALMKSHEEAVKAKNIILTPLEARRLSNILSDNKAAQDLKERLDEELLKI